MNSIDYALAKDLYDAGFEKIGGWWDEELGKKPPGRYSHFYGVKWLTEDGHWYCGGEEPHLRQPTLAELIEACGEGFAALERHYGRPGMAYGSYPEPVLWWEARSSKGDTLHTGSTPDIAVARLWLAIHRAD